MRKCSQVGLSELMVQKVLAMCATMQHTRIIFTLPTRDMAMPFSKDRFDGAIDQSDFYSGLVERASNSASQKRSAPARCISLARLAPTARFRYRQRS